MSFMMQALVSIAGRLLDDWHRAWLREQEPAFRSRPFSPPFPVKYQPLRRITLTDEVGRTLYEEYASHKKGARGGEETGWILLGLRETDEAVVLATFPAGTAASAGEAHVLFNANAQALGSCIVRQQDRRLCTLGVVHTHPGTLRHPSDGDYRGDSVWIEQLRGGEGVFGIGTEDAVTQPGTLFARHWKPHIQYLGGLCFSWYALGPGDASYRPLPCNVTIGPDLARPLHKIWPTLEIHAEPLDRLFRQLSGVKFEVEEGKTGPALALIIPLAENTKVLRIVLEGKNVRYFLDRDEELRLAESAATSVDRGAYLLLAELAAHKRA